MEINKTTKFSSLDYKKKISFFQKRFESFFILNTSNYKKVFIYFNVNTNFYCNLIVTFWCYH